jgi:hypothetical protein
MTCNCRYTSLIPETADACKLSPRRHCALNPLSDNGIDGGRRRGQ